MKPQELIQKINETFGIDILARKKTTDILWFRYYIMDKLMMHPVSECCEILKRNEKQIYNLRKKIPMIRDRSEFKTITRVVETLDPLLLESLVKPPAKIKRLPTNQVMEILRKNRKSHLWKIDFKDWSKKDWEILKSY